jgi:hypothetical protein
MSRWLSEAHERYRIRATVVIITTRLMGAMFDASKDGRFLIPTSVDQTTDPPINVVVNWTAGLKK